MSMAANDGHYNAIVWGLALTTAISAYFFLRGMLFTIVSLFVLVALVSAFVGFARSRRKRTVVFAYNRHTKTILADLIIESLKISLFSILLDTSIQGTTYKAITGNFSDEAGIWRLGVLLVIMFIGYVWCIADGYASSAKSERKSYAEAYNIPSSDVL
jgi:hypothetical protein